jgi:hypothetical protein
LETVGLQHVKKSELSNHAKKQISRAVKLIHVLEKARDVIIMVLVGERYKYEEFMNQLGVKFHFKTDEGSTSKIVL